MNSQHTFDLIRLLATSCLISLITITYLTSSIEGSNAKTDGWSNTHNRRLYPSDLTGTMRELKSTDNSGETDTRFQPPLDTNNQKIQPIVEGYRVANTEAISPAISVSINKDISHERHKRDAPSGNTTTPTVSLQSTISVNTEPIATTLSNNVTDDDSILSDADANSWALNLLLGSPVDGSGSEYETTAETSETITTQTEITTIQLHTTEESIIYSLTSTISSVQNETEIIIGFSTLTTEATAIVSTTAYVTEEEFNNTGVSQTSFTLVSSASTTITSLESTQTEEVTITGTETPIVSSTTGTETESVSGTEILSTSTASPTISSGIFTTQTVTESSLETEVVTSSEASTSEVLVTQTTTEQSTQEVTNNVSETEVSSTTTTIQSSTEASPGTEEGSTIQTTSSGLSFTSTTQISAEQSTISTGEETVSETEVSPTTTTSSLSAITSSSSLGTQIVTSVETGTMTVGETETSTTTLSTSQTSTATTFSTSFISENTGETSSAETISVSTASSSPLITSNIQTNTESVASTVTVSESELSSLQSTLSTLTTVQTTNQISLSSSSSISITSATPSVTEIETSSTTASTVSATSIQTSTEIYEEPTPFNLYFDYNPTSGRRKRMISIISSTSSTLENEIANILYSISIICNGTCIEIAPNNNTEPPNIGLSVILNKFLNVSQRIVLVNQLFVNNVTLNDSYVLGIVEISMNLTAVVFLNFNTTILPCEECEFSGRGNCSNNNTECTCLPAYDGLYCRNVVQTTTIYLPTSISTSTATLSTTTISSAQTGGSLTGSTATFTESTSITSQSSPTYSTSTTITVVTETIETETASITLPASSSTASEVSPFEGTAESTTLGTSSSTTSTATNTLFSPTNTGTIENTSATLSSTVAITSASLTVTIGTTTETVEATATTSSSLTTTTGTAGETETVQITSVPTVTTETITGGISTSQVTAETLTSSSTTTLAVTVETVETTTATTLTTGTTSSTITATAITSQATGTIESTSTTTTASGASTASSTAATVEIETIETTTASTIISQTISSTAALTSYITGGTATGEATTFTAITGTPLSSSTTTPTITAQTSFSTTTIGITEGTATGEASSSTTTTGTGSVSSTTISAVTAQTSYSTTTTVAAQETATSETSSSTSITGTGSISSTTTSTITAQTSFSTTTAGITEIAATGQTSSSTITTETGSISSTTTSTVTAQSISFQTSAVTEQIVTGETTLSTSTTGTGSISSTTTPAVTAQSISFIETTSSVTEQTLTSETSSSTTATGTGSVSSTTTSTVTAQTSFSTTTAGVTEITATGQTSSSTITTGTGSVSSTTTSTVTAQSISFQTSAVTEQTVTGVTTSSTSTTEPGSSISSTTTPTVTEQTSFSTTTIGITEITATGQTSSSTTTTGTGSISSTTTPAVTAQSISFQTSTVTEQTVTGITTSSTSTTGTGSSISSTTTPTATGQTSFSTTTIGITEITATGQTSSSTTTTGTGSVSSTTISAVTAQTSYSTTTTGITEIVATGQTSSSTATTGTGSISSTTTSTVTTQSISFIETSSITQVPTTGQTSSSTTTIETGITSSSSTTTISTSAAETISSATTSGVIQETVTSVASSSTATTETGSPSSTTTSGVTVPTISSTEISETTEKTVTGATSTLTTITGITGASSTTTSTITAQTTSFTTATGTTEGTVTSEASSATISEETGSSSSTIAQTVTSQSISSTVTTISSATGQSVTSETATLTATTETGSSIGTTTSTAAASRISSTGTSGTTEETGTGGTSTLTAITITTTVSSVPTSSATTQTISATSAPIQITEGTLTSEVSSASVTTETGSSISTSAPTTTAQTTSSTVTTISSVTGQTASSETVTLTTTTGTASSIGTTVTTPIISSTGISGTTEITSSGSTTTLITSTQTISLTTATGSTEETVTSEAPSASVTTETSSFSSTTASIVSSITTSISSTAGQTETSETTTITTFTQTTSSSSISTTTGTISVTITTESATSTFTTVVTSSITSSSVTSTASTTTMATSTSQVVTTTVPTTTATTATTATTITTATTAITQRCAWTNWVPIGNCTPSCGTAYQEVIRSCINSITGQSCDSTACGGGSAIQNQSCPASPPCATLIIVPQNTTRDPSIQIYSYLLPDSMYFFEQTYTRIWITNKGYITFGTPYYGETMTSTLFSLLYNQAVAAPFWADLTYDSTSNMTINWFNSLNASQTDTNTYYSIIQRTVNDACPVQYCSLTFTALRAVRINWANLYYQPTNTNQSIAVSFTAYLINTYETPSSPNSYPLLRSYLSFDYSNLPSNLGYLKPFVGYRGKSSFIQTLNDPSYYQNAMFLTQSSYQSLYIGARFLTQCEVSYLQETSYNDMNPSDNLNNVINNPQNPCPCSLGQAQIDRRFSRLNSENSYETLQRVICYGPMTTSWIRWGWNFRPLRTQTCCYNIDFGGLITYGALAGSVLSDPSVIFQPFPWLRRIAFHDNCCSPTFPSGQPDWSTCSLYYQLHPASTCTGYQPPTILTGIGDPHVNTIDNGRYTCHIQGLYIFARTSANATLQANNNANMGNVSSSNLLYPDDLFYIYVRSISVPPALPYIERVAGDASIFSSYTIGAANYTFVISNINGRFGFTASNSTFNSSLTSILSSNLNYDYINTNDTNERYIYRLQQTSVPIGSITVPQLVFSIWSGFTIQCQIISENLNCILLLPQKYFTYIEGLAGNFNGNYSDDLVNLQTNQIVLIYSASNGTVVGNDFDILAACRSWKVPNDTTPDMTNPIMPINFVNWYNTNSSGTLSGLNSKLSPNIVIQTCATNFECTHDYLIQINPITCAATASSLNSFEQSRIILAQIPPTVNITSAVNIAIPYNNPDRTAVIPITITGANTTIVSINANGTIENSTFNGQNIMIPMFPNDNSSYVEVSLNLIYGTNFTTIVFLDIIACLCVNPTSCDYTDVTTISTHYQLASCICSDEYDGIFCQLPYDGCGLSSACRIDWDNNTICVPLNASEQIRLGRSYTCEGINGTEGSCVPGYASTDNYTCQPINLCNSTTCGNGGTCLNTIGSYICLCPTGFQFANGTCVDINECVERYVNGNFTAHCGIGYTCTNTIGSFTCTCDDIFLNTITNSCNFNASLCQNDTCISSSSSNVTCIRGAVNMYNTCVPWCASTCPGFCQLMDDFYQCNCWLYPGFQPSNNGLTCSQCGYLNYGYGCNQSCQCNFGICNPNGTNANNSCSCGGYQAPTCSRRINICALNNSCNPATEICQTNPISGNATCSCLVGYGFNSTVNTCTDINECLLQQDQCNPSVSNCSNTIGSYLCICLPGYQSVNGSCVDIDECTENVTICSPYINTFCTNTPGSYECRCNTGYSLGGDYTQAYGNARNSNSSCLQSNYSSFCENECLAPASCSSITGQCECPTPSYNLTIDNTNDILQTCICPGGPFVYFNGSTCVTFTAQTQFVLEFSQSNSRMAALNTTDSNNIQNDITIILSGMNITCGSSCVNLYNTLESTSTDILILVTLNVPLNVTQRLQLSNQLFNRSLTYNSLPLKSLQINMNPATPDILVTLTGVVPVCDECQYTRRGTCTPDGTNCDCYQNYTGYLCRDISIVNLGQSASQEANWTVIVAVVSAVAGLLLIISVVMCVFYCISKRRQSTTITKPSIGRQQFTIPRAHLPTMGTVSREWDGFSLDNTYDEQFVDASDSFPSSSTTSYNTTYQANGKRLEADFGIFDELENRIPMSKSHIPRPQMKDMLGTLNSFPTLDQFDEPSGETSIFSDSRDLDEIELVTDMLDDMTKDDDIEDEFVEALNPNLAIPRLSLEPETQSSSWFSFFRNS